MTTERPFKFSNWVIALPLFSAWLLWFVYWLQIKYNFDFDVNGIYPRRVSGLQGVLFSPFIHEDIEHLYNNSISLIVLLASMRYFYPKQVFSVVFFGIFISGFITWVIGRPNYHIGASGLIYVLISFIFFKGIQTRYYRLVALSLTIVLIYGGAIWYVFPKVEEKISWESHLAGFITGLLFVGIHKAIPYKKAIKYDWEHPDFDPSQDKFMQRFDENGNFVNLPKIDEEDETDGYFVSNTSF